MHFDFMSIRLGTQLTCRNTHGKRFVVVDYDQASVYLVNLNKRFKFIPFKFVHVVSYDTLNRDYKVW